MAEKRIIDLLADSSTKEKAFELIVSNYGECLYWKIRQMVLWHDDANDVLQNTFLKAWKNIDTLRDKSRLTTWLFSIAVNESLDFIRKRKNNSMTDDSDSVADRLMADDLFDGDRAEALLRQAVAMLPDVQRTVFCLRYFDNMRYSEMSEYLQTSEGALKASYHIAVRKITEFLKESE
ncbi:MAG: RNA polymerase sigma factor [Prevotella sp.]|nr:RNA polymerase sigma factor [Prevotella sp.]MBQ4633712.1 RNA polymerase sigma factor [Prevotella sp.]MBQ8628934.1 RNA polymerase sigma factor [Prevotella sp.]